jgi:DNA-binding GntR family transcriptional regulator
MTMGIEKITSQLKEKIPSYVPIYNKLYMEIISGELPDGSQLPSESTLTEKYGVSRNTLRQALTVLNEDGLISKRQGRGTLIHYSKENKAAIGMKICNPMLHYAKDAIEAIDISFNFAPPTDVAQKKLAIKANEIIMASNVVYIAGGKPIGRAFIQIPTKHIEKIHVDLNVEDEVSNLVNKTIFERSTTAKLMVRVIRAEGEITDFLKITEEEPLLYIEEILSNKEGEALARCKFYFIPECYDVTLLL